MNPKELRIGNLVKNWDRQGDPGAVDQVIAADFSPVHWLELYEPIPLTEEWLLRLGFEKDTKNQKSYFHPVSAVHLSFKNITALEYGFRLMPGVEMKDCFWGISKKSIQFVHQIQNLIFALTGTELEIKELSQNTKSA